MNRREALAASAFIASLNCASPVAADTRTFRLGVLAFSDPDPKPAEDDVLLAALAGQGYVVGRNLVIERRFWRAGELDAAASALAAMKVDVILVDGTEPALAAKRATASIPIVFTSADPVGFGLVSSLARPGGNLTGFSIQGAAITAKEMEAIAEALGALHSLAYIHSVEARSLPWYKAYLAAATSAAKALGVRIEFHEASTFAAYEPLIQELVRRGVDAAELMPAAALAPTDAEYGRLAALFLRYRLPAIGPARSGFLLQCEFAADLISQRLAYFVGRIFGGTKVSELPVEQFSTLRLILNLKTARALGVTPPRSLLIRADQFIQ